MNEDVLVEIPWDVLAAETLDRLLEEFVTRDGTDYGEEEVPVNVRVEQVRRALKQRKCVILFDTVMETTQIVDVGEWRGKRDIRR